MQSNAESQIRIGPAGWSYPDWDGIVYPSERTRSFDPLPYLARFFDMIEINSTFYRTPSRATCRRWVDRVTDRPGFMFTAKAPQEMTHRSLPASERDVASFRNAIEPLYENRRLGAVLLQFPWSFRMSNEAHTYIGHLRDWFRPLPTAVEVRHGTWGTSSSLCSLRESGIPLCGIDQPMIGDSLSSGTYVAAADLAYFRLHGRNKEKWFSKDTNRDDRYNYLYDVSELSPWRDVIRAARGQARNVFVVLNNHFRGQAVVNALQLKAMLTGRPSVAPRHLVASYRKTGDLLTPEREPEKPTGSDREGQLDLFGEQERRSYGEGSEEDQ